MTLKSYEWTKFSGGGSNCVEVMRTADEVLVRNSNRPDEPPQRFTHTEWAYFTQGAKLGVFDLD
ncbi:DUF397 domain-containing protein [Saccharothrix coeruleofusca]|uniref:DUF397 domain-containing protein n=1 Tax=Saccharothrix coeruleofusca TaxID=33919 RepID=A0A918AMP0_9PSEU|nr:DUF397 domain-containing protein [Saccharothrix coeruleofusca]MBP2338581.1 hypothetical protein [Saccharothrix coeruleofusca]GGP47413.1 hypothetical protein GCM10010185_19020 [Saccharothrix coeruleofusca]